MALNKALADDVLADPAWPALAAQLRRIEAGGVDAGRALSPALQSRELFTAKSVAQVLHHRLLASNVRGPQVFEGSRRSNSAAAPTHDLATIIHKRQ
jgi:hypothetical protein